MGIETDRLAGVRTDYIAGIGANAPAPTVIPDFMEAFRNGFITVDDLQRRMKSGISDTSNLKTQLAADDFKRKRIADEETLAPAALDIRKRQMALTGQDLGVQETLSPAKQLLAEKEALDIKELSDPEKRPDALNRKRRESLESVYADRVGELPQTFMTDKPAKVVDLNTWLEENLNPRLLKEANEFQSGFPLNSAEDNQARAAFYNKRHDELAAEAPKMYQEYVKKQQGAKEEIPRMKDGKINPAYEKRLADVLTQRLQQDALQGVQLGAYKVGLESAAKTAGEGPGKIGEVESKDRAQYLGNQAIQDFRKVAPAYYKIEEAITGQSTPFKDMQAIFSFMKVLDPGSTVREGEYATAENARSVPDTMKNFYNKVVVGTKLTEEQRVQLKDAAKGALVGQVQGAAPVIEQFLSLEKQGGGKPGNIVPIQDQRLYHDLFPQGLTGALPTAKPAASAVPAAPTSYDEVLGQRVTLKDGRSGIVTKLPDGTYTLK